MTRGAHACSGAQLLSRHKQIRLPQCLVGALMLARR